MKYLKSFNENNSYSEEQMDNINDICLELEDLGLQYRIIVSTADGDKFKNHLFVDWEDKTPSQSMSGFYEKNMVIEIYDKYDECSGSGCENGSIKITKEFITIINRLKEYLDTKITIGIYYHSTSTGRVEDYTELSMPDPMDDEVPGWLAYWNKVDMNQIDINTKNSK